MDTFAQRITALSQQNHLWLMYVFGSRAHEVWAWLQNDEKRLPASSSDVDIAVLPAAWLTLEQKITLTLALEDLLGVARVDLVSLPEADPFLAANIIRGERLYVLDAHQADEYELYILRRAGDLVELERERISFILREDKPPYDAR